MVPPAVEVRDLVKQYNGRSPVLDGITFTIEKSAFVILFGKSGCGKTTLLNILGGLDRPTTGDVMIEGDSLLGLSEDRLASLRLEKVGFVFQDYNLLMDLTVRENVALPLKFSKKSEGRTVDDMLRKFAISEIADESARRISGGESQRVAIARAMMNGPRLILADEPTGNLDSENTRKVIDAFRLVRQEFGTTIILATHDESLSEYATSRIGLKDGKATIDTGPKHSV